VIGRHSLLDLVRGLLERTYGMQPPLGDLGHYVVGDLGYRQFYSGGEVVRVVESPDGHGARTLVRETNHGMRLAVYFPDAMIEWLERHSPLAGLDESNVQAFATLVEELDHLLVIAERFRIGRPVTLFELELHANVSKYLVLSRFLAGSSPVLTEHKRLWLLHHLFDSVRFCDDESEVRRRYEEATRWAVRFLSALRRIDPQGRLRTLRRFHGSAAADKLRLIDLCAA
jgi:hypothetical protein